MAGLLSYVAAGAAEGVGQGLLEKASALREQKRSQFRTMTPQESQSMGLDQGGVYQVSGDGRINTVQQPGKPAPRPSINLYGPNGGTQQVGIGSEEEAHFRKAGYGDTKPKSEKAPGKWVDLFSADGKSQRVQEGTEDYSRLVSSGWTGTAPKTLKSNGLDEKSYASIVFDARKAATTKDSLSGKETLDPVAFAENLIATGVPLKPETIRSAQRGIRQSIRKDVRAEAQGRKGGMFSDDDYGGKTEAEWVREETERRTQEKLTEIGLTGQRAPSPPTQQNVGSPSGQGAVSNDQAYIGAKAALDRGVDPMTVMKRFEELGLDYSGFEAWVQQGDAATARATGPSGG